MRNQNPIRITDKLKKKSKNQKYINIFCIQWFTKRIETEITSFSSNFLNTFVESGTIERAKRFDEKYIKPSVEKMCTQSSASNFPPNFIFQRYFYVIFNKECCKADDLKEIYCEVIMDAFVT